MTDIATLGLAVDSRPVSAATAELNKFAAASKPAAAGATALERAAASAAKSTATITAQSGLARHEMVNLSRQVQDVGVSLASGQSPFMVLAQQGTQIADIFATSGGTVRGALRQMASGIASVITPMRLLGVGAVAAGVAAYAMNSAWKSSELQFDDTGRAIGATIGQLHALEKQASGKGIDTEEFLKGAERFGSLVYQARNNMGGLADVMRVNGVTAGTFTEHLERAADLIKNASTDQQRLQLLQQMGLPATMEWVRFLSQGSEAIRRAVDEAKLFDATANGSLIAKARQFDEEWNRAWSEFKNQAKRAVIEVKTYFDELSLYGNAALLKIGVNVGPNLLKADMGTPLQQDFSDFYKATGATRTDERTRINVTPKPTVDPNVLRNQISLEQRRLGLLGQTTTALEARRQVELQLQSAALDGVSIDKTRADTLKRIAEENAIGVTAIRSQADALRIEAETIGMGVGPATSYLAVQTRLNEARRNGQVLTPANIEAIRAEAGALGEAAARADSMRWSYENLVRGPLQAFRSALAQGATFWDAFKKAGVSALDSISSKLMDMAAQNLWKAAFGGGGGGGGLLSGLSSLFGGGGGIASSGLGSAISGLYHTGGIVGEAGRPGRYVHPAYFDDAPRFHTGGVVGDEVPIVAKKGEGVFTKAQMAAMAPAGASTVVNITNNNDFSGADPGSESRIKQYVDSRDEITVQRAVAEIEKLHRNSPATRGAR